LNHRGPGGVVGAAGDRRGSAAKLLAGQSTSEVDFSSLKELLRGGMALVGAAGDRRGLAAKLLVAPITLVDKRTLFVKSTSEVDLFVPKGTPTRRYCTCRSLLPNGVVSCEAFGWLINIRG
jgi:hypothetical protein